MSIDSVDVAILRAIAHDASGQCFQTDPTLTYRSISRQVGISPDTVARRIIAMRRSGFLRSMRLGVNPRVLGHHSSFVYFDARNEAERDAAVESIRSLSSVPWLTTCLGSSAGFLVTHATEELGEEEVRGYAPGLQRAHSVMVVRHGFYAPEGTPSPIDWRIIHSLAEPGAWDYARAGAELGLSSHAIRRRLERMVRARMFFVLPDMDLAALEGGVMGSLAGSFRDEEGRRSFEAKMLPLLGGYYFLTPSAEPTYAAYLCIFPNCTIAEHLRRMGQSLPGVQSLSLRPYLSMENRLPLRAPITTADILPLTGPVRERRVPQASGPVIAPLLVR